MHSHLVPRGRRHHFVNLPKIQDHQTGDQVLDLVTRQERHLLVHPAVAIAEEVYGEETVRA